MPRIAIVPFLTSAIRFQISKGRTKGFAAVITYADFFWAAKMFVVPVTTKNHEALRPAPGLDLL